MHALPLLLGVVLGVGLALRLFAALLRGLLWALIGGAVAFGFAAVHAALIHWHALLSVLR